MDRGGRRQNLIDLISDTHMVLRRQVMERTGEEVNKTEMHVISILETHGPQSISEIARIIGISRQGVHKCVQGLLSAELVHMADAAGNNRDKPIELTEKARLLSRHMRSVKEEVEKQIVEKIGAEQAELLRRLLQASAAADKPS
ncbi:MarR family winged helix-turn-helix transcriptional regulator [Paenibacillus turpanensis]|uniref:MarR family winged helix-turn-helix transcriptional regulator n=1 Tax=Paenibacillus turpanensis TaxID=2689078 RepID=UPI00140AF209|nr:MarR family transcriptional regulator [Paenibacillus turpanensis]